MKQDAGNRGAVCGMLQGADYVRYGSAFEQFVVDIFKLSTWTSISYLSTMSLPQQQKNATKLMLIDSTSFCVYIFKHCVIFTITVD